MILCLWNAIGSTTTGAVRSLVLFGAALLMVTPCRAQGPAPARPDLVVQQITIFGTTPEVKVLNRGFARSSSMQLKLANVKPEVGNAGGSQVMWMAPLEPGESAIMRFTRVFRSGKLVADVDVGNRVAESNERNNRKTVVLRDSRKQPDFSVVLSKIDKDKDKIVIILVNNGTVTSPNAALQLKAHNVRSREIASRTITVPQVGAGRVKTIQAAFRMPAATRIISAHIDPSNRIIELDEGNNRAAKTVD